MVHKAMTMLAKLVIFTARYMAAITRGRAVQQEDQLPASHTER